MNANATAYTPSPSLRPMVRPGKQATVVPSVTLATSSGRDAPVPHTSVGTGTATSRPVSAADHLRQLHKAHTEQGRPLPHDHEAHTGHTSVPAPEPAPSPAVTAAQSSPVAAARRQRYSRDVLLAVQPNAIEAVRQGPVTDEPPFLKIPATFAPLLRQPFALEYVDVDSASSIVAGRTYVSPLMAADRGSAGASASQEPSAVNDAFHVSGNEGTDVRNYHCTICRVSGGRPCPALAEVIKNATRYAMRSKEGACLLQAPEVVTGLLQLLLVFESKKSSMRMRRMAENHPAIVRRITAFLCGEGYHLPLPSVTAHESWRTMMGLLKFDAIRDNRTRIIHDFSKHWKKRHTPFEQFVYFFSFRYAVPVGSAKNIPTCSVKPGMVAMLSGDVMAMVLLHHLNFFIPPDYYWSVYPYLHRALGEGSLAYDVVRHLGVCLSSRQDASVFFNPIEDPALSRPPRT